VDAHHDMWWILKKKSITESRFNHHRKFHLPPLLAATEMVTRNVFWDRSGSDVGTLFESSRIALYPTPGVKIKAVSPIAGNPSGRWR
jgi:hypothetical protein